MTPKILHGTIAHWYETGSEGVCWVFYRDGKKSWDEAVEFLERGDRLKIFSEDGTSIIFDGVIKPDSRIGWKRYPMNPKYGQPCALGYWIHWTQKGWKPDDWAKLFVRKEGQKPLRAELIQKPRSAP